MCKVSLARENTVLSEYLHHSNNLRAFICSKLGNQFSLSSELFYYHIFTFF